MKFKSLSTLIMGRPEAVSDSDREYSLKIAQSLQLNNVQENLGAEQVLTHKRGEMAHLEVCRLFGNYFSDMFEDGRPHVVHAAEYIYLDPYDGKLNRYGWLTVPALLLPDEVTKGFRRMQMVRKWATEHCYEMPKIPEGRFPPCIGLLAEQEGVSRQAFAESVRMAMQTELDRA
jgi:hypothetical protein